MQVKVDSTEQNIKEYQEEKFNEEQDYIESVYQILQRSDPLEAPKKSQIEAWKDRYKNVYISQIVEPDKFYVWRTLTRVEYKKLNANKEFDNPQAAYEIMVETCLLYPQPTQAWRLNSPAGWIDTLGKQIAFQSGWVSDQEHLATIRVF
jgi:hypothetical protein